MRRPIPKNPPRNAPKSLETKLKKIGAKKIWEVRRTPTRKDDKAFVWVTETCDASKKNCKYKTVRFGSIASEKVRFDSRKRMRNFRSRFGCDKKKAPWNTALRAACDIIWYPGDPLRTVKNCSNCK